MGWGLLVLPLYLRTFQVPRGRGEGGGVWTLGPPVVRNPRGYQARPIQVGIPTSTELIMLRKDRWGGDILVSGMRYPL